jgi:tRNA (guanine26-N2/guanine27-N2)-dimethyltransferase
VCVNAEYSHEVALRLVLNSIAQAAARYGRYITPLISLSIDFYVRLFIRVDTRPVEVKRLASQTGVVYACNFCQTPVEQPFGRINERQGSKGNINLVYRSAANQAGPGTCTQCGSPQHLAGPMWLGPIQDSEFIQRVITNIDADKEFYGTWPRMHGMLSLAKEEIANPFYFTCNKIAGFAHATPPPTKVMMSALLNAGYKVSRSHAVSGSIKTDASRDFVFDVLREWIKEHPVRMDKINENSPTRQILAKEQT